MTNLWAASNHAARDGIVLSRRPCRSHPPHAHLFVQTLITRVKFTTWRAQRSTDRSAETYAGRRVFRHDMLVIYFASAAVAVWLRRRPLRGVDSARLQINFFNAHVLQDFTKLMPNIHRHTRHDKTVLSVSCLVCRCELGDCSGSVRTSNFLSATVLSCRKSSSHHRRGRDTDKTVLSCLTWRCEFAFTHF